MSSFTYLEQISSLWRQVSRPDDGASTNWRHGRLRGAMFNTNVLDERPSVTSEGGSSIRAWSRVRPRRSDMPRARAGQCSRGGSHSKGQDPERDDGYHRRPGTPLLHALPPVRSSNRHSSPSALFLAHSPPVPSSARQQGLTLSMGLTRLLDVSWPRVAQDDLSSAHRHPLRRVARSKLPMVIDVRARDWVLHWDLW